ncbi:serine/threonine protein kinase [Apiospora saccharicola]
MDEASRVLTSKAVTSLSRSRQEQNCALARLTRQARDGIEQVLQALRKADKPSHEVSNPAGGSELQPNGRYPHEKTIKVAKDRLQKALKGLVRSGREALGKGVPEFMWWDFGRDLAEVSGTSAADIADSILAADGPWRSPREGRVPGMRDVRDRPLPYVLRRVLGVVERRQNFLHSAPSSLISLIGEQLQHDNGVLQDAADKMDRALPKNPDETAYSEKGWRCHVFMELRPFLCLVEDCRVPNRTYVAREDWERHMISAHSYTAWICPVLRCSSSSARQAFSREQELVKHLRTEHPRFPPPSLCHDHRDETNSTMAKKRPWVVEEAIKRCEYRIVSPHLYRCPLCREPLETLERYLGHVGDHLETIALLSVR